jgi:hypothetical protein
MAGLHSTLGGLEALRCNGQGGCCGVEGWLIPADADIPSTELETNSDSPLFLNIFLNPF